MKPKFGASTLSWISPQWNDENTVYAIEQASMLGFDLVEILLPPSLQINTSLIRKQLEQKNISAVCGLNLPKEAHIPFYPKEATVLMKKTIDVVHELGLSHLGGVLHSGIGVFSGTSLAKNEKITISNVWTEVAEYALHKNVTLGVEPINRYESYVCNIADNVLELMDRVGAPNIYLHLDTFHMCMEEKDFYKPIIKAGRKLKQIHMTESNRGMLGEGNVNWNDLFKALHEINFEGNLVLENFSSFVPSLADAVSLWQSSDYNAEDLAKGSLEFMQKKSR